MHKRSELILALPLLAAASAVFIPHSFFFARTALLVLVVASFGVAYWLLQKDHNVYRSRVAALSDVNRYAKKIASSLVVPCCILSPDGVLWHNPSYERLLRGRDLAEMIPEIKQKKLSICIRAEVDERLFDVNILALHNDGEEPLWLLYWLEKTHAIKYKALCERLLPTICLIQIDNYDEISETKYNRAGEVISAVERHIFSAIRTSGGLVKRTEPGRYFAIVERKHLDEMEKQRFSLLDLARETGTKADVPVSISIAVGKADTLGEAADSAQKAMELALGRGGDQAVVKAGTNYTFYGGKRQPVERQSKVKSRLFARALRNLMSQCSRVFVMGHKMSDLDCMGAALGVARCAKLANKRVQIVLDFANVSIERFVAEMKSRPEYSDLIIRPEEARDLVGADSMLVIVDTQRALSTVAPDLIQKAGTLVVIDHHRKGTNAIANATLSYNEPQSSSTCELVTETLQYFDTDVRLSPFESGALLAGITIDTKNFAFNAGVRTFEAASYLRRCGADTNFIKQIFQDDMETYVNRALVVKSSQIIEGNIAIAVCPPSMPNAELLAAQAADALTTIRGIQAAFVLGSAGGNVFISGRSLGEISVQLILETLGGGGHINIAGAQIAGVTLEQAKTQLIEAVKTYCKEDNPHESHTRTGNQGNGQERSDS